MPWPSLDYNSTLLSLALNSWQLSRLSLSRAEFTGISRHAHQKMVKVKSIADFLQLSLYNIKSQ